MSSNAQQESSLVAHARRELSTIGEDQDFSDSIIAAIKGFETYGHSGGSHTVGVAVLVSLLNHENLSALTDDPAEWLDHGNNTWQNTRNGEAFSHDGGKTFYLLSEGAHDFNRAPIHESRYHKPCESCGARTPHQHSPRCRNNPVNIANS